MSKEMAELPRLAEADGVFFITLAKGDRASVATTIERLIDMLDAMEPDPDLEDGGDDEPWLGWCGQSRKQYGGRDDREEACEDEGGQCEDEGAYADKEPSLGWTSDEALTGFYTDFTDRDSDREMEAWT